MPFNQSGSSVSTNFDTYNDYGDTTISKVVYSAFEMNALMNTHAIDVSVYKEVNADKLKSKSFL